MNINMSEEEKQNDSDFHRLKLYARREPIRFKNAFNQTKLTF